MVWSAIALPAAALDRLGDAHRWTQRGYALDGRGRQVTVDDPRARRHCLIGAVLLAAHRRSGVPMPVATDPEPEPDDLTLPVAPGAPPNLALALDALGWAAEGALKRAGVNVTAVPDGFTNRHFPMLLGLHRRSRGHAKAIETLPRAIALLAHVSLNDDLTARMVEIPGAEEAST